MLQKQCDTNQVTSALCDMYQEDLPFQFDAVCCQKNISFPDVRFISVLVIQRSSREDKAEVQQRSRDDNEAAER